MKKALSITAALLAAALCLTLAFAAGGDAGDPLVSLGYLQGIFQQTVNTAVDTELAEADNELRTGVSDDLAALRASAEAAAGQNYAPVATEVTLKYGDTLTGPTGLVVTPLGGDVTLAVTYGAVVDITDGSEVPTDTLLTVDHRYLVAEDSLVRFVVSSPAAVVSYQGNYALSYSTGVPDYYSIACALRQLGLFMGSGTGIGEGFDLYLTPTRGESLVMFIRMLGEEDLALACDYTHPFTDVPSWLDPYVAWAYTNGYTNGVGNNKFGSSQPIVAIEYQEFLLRALGYSVAGVHDYTTSLERSVEHGALTQGEYEMLKDSELLRAHMAYVSYYTMDVILSGSQMTLAQSLESKGIFTGFQLTQARYTVSTPRVQ